MSTAPSLNPSPEGAGLPGTLVLSPAPSGQGLGEGANTALRRWACLICLLGVVSVGLSGCNFGVQPTSAPTVTEPSTATQTLTVFPTQSTAVAFVPSATTRPSPTASITPTATRTPSATPTITPTSAPTLTPWATSGFVGDQFKRVDVPKPVIDAIGKTWLSFINVSDANPPGTPGTPVTASDKETVYLVSPDGGTRLKVIDLPASTDRRVYWSPNGAYLAYFLAEGAAPGLYLLDLQNRATTRLFDVPDLTPRGFQIEPAWSPDSTQLTVALTTPYSVNIFSVAVDGTGFRDLSNSGAFDLWPSWSPDGAFLAFVSDRAACPSWIPGDPGSCSAADAKTPIGGTLYVLDAVNHQIRPLADTLISSPPHWITATRLAFTSATPDGSASALWWVDLRGGAAHSVTGNASTSGAANATSAATAFSTAASTPQSGGAGGSSLALRDSWSPDGRLVIYQAADTSTHIVLRDENGAEIGRFAQFNFPRYSFSAAWAPDGKHLAIGGHNGQCPYGMLITDDKLKVIVNSPPAPGICDPVWSPDGKYIAFTGITQSNGSSDARDGRYDLYVAEASGYGIHSLTGRLGGQIRILGWLKGTG